MGTKNKIEDQIEENRSSKVKRHEFDLPPSELVDVNLANKLDSILRLQDKLNSKPKFVPNKTRQELRPTNFSGEPDKISLRRDLACTCKEELFKKYDTLTPELDPKRPNVKMMKLLSINESLKLARDEAEKQMDREMYLNTVSGNLCAQKKKAKKFVFNDGYEMPLSKFDKNNRRGSASTEYDQETSKPSSSKSKAKSKVLTFEDDERAAYVDFFTPGDDDNITDISGSDN